MSTSKNINILKDNINPIGSLRSSLNTKLKINAVTHKNISIMDKANANLKLLKQAQHMS